MITGAQTMDAAEEAKMLLDSLIATSQHMLVTAEAGEWDLLPDQQVDRENITASLEAMHLSDDQRFQLRHLFELAQSINGEVLLTVVRQREVARNKLLEFRRAENMQHGYGYRAGSSIDNC